MTLALVAVGWGGNAFSPMLVVYERELAVDPSLLAAMFAVYAVGLVGGLLMAGAVSDARGRRGIVVAFTALSTVGTALLMAAPNALWLMTPARAISGLAAGAVFAAGSAWLLELSVAAGDSPAAGPRRTAAALSTGFAVGPLVSGTLASIAPSPLVVAYAPQLLVAAVAVVALRRVPETVASGGRRRAVLPAAARAAGFWQDLIPLAPWVFVCASVSFAVIPTALGNIDVGIAGLVTAGTLGVGVAIQPVARRLSLRVSTVVGLACASAGALVGAAAVATETPVLLALSAPILGAGYGLTLVAGLRTTELHADATERGAALAMFYSLTYLGFAAPSTIDAARQLVAPASALVGVALLAGVSALWAATRRVGPAAECT